MKCSSNMNRITCNFTKNIIKTFSVFTIFQTPGELSSEESDAETEATLPPAHSGVYDSACSSPTGLLPDPQPTPLPAYGAPLPKVSNTTVAALGALGLHRGPLLVPGPASVGAAPSPAATGLHAPHTFSTSDTLM